MWQRDEINVRLLREILALFPTVELCAKAFGVSYSHLVGLINLKFSPLRQDGNPVHYEYIWREMCETVAHNLGYSVAELFPPEVYPLPTGANEPKDPWMGEVPLNRRVDPKQVFPRTIHAGRLMARLMIDRTADVVKAVDRRVLLDLTRVLLRRLSFRQREVLKLRFGLGGSHEYTLQEVATIFRISVERTRQVECEALHKLKMWCERARCDQHAKQMYHYWNQSTDDPLGPEPDESPLTL
jgi:hypothetical protein